MRERRKCEGWRDSGTDVTRRGAMTCGYEAVNSTSAHVDTRQRMHVSKRGHNAANATSAHVDIRHRMQHQHTWTQDSECNVSTRQHKAANATSAHVNTRQRMQRQHKRPMRETYRLTSTSSCSQSIADPSAPTDACRCTVRVRTRTHADRRLHVHTGTVRVRREDNTSPDIQTPRVRTAPLL